MSVPNVIPDRIADALGRFPPFSMLADEDVDALAREAEVCVITKGNTLWKQGEVPVDELMFLARGRVEYHWQQSEGRSELVDVRDVGDVLALSALIEGKAFRVTAKVVEDSLLYLLPWDRMRKLLSGNDAARNYVRRHIFWGTRVGRDSSLPEWTDDRAVGGRAKTILQTHLDGAQVIRPRGADRLMTCAPADSIHQVAKLMASRRVKSVLVVDENRRPLGIVTASNLVKEVVAGDLDKKTPVNRVMAKPVVTVSAGSSATAAMLVMMRQRIGQVCVTEDGTSETQALDVCTEKDLLTQSGNHPAGLIREMRHARTIGRLRELCDDVEGIAHSYLETGVSAIFLGQICAELYDELVQKLIEMALSEMSGEGLKLPKRAWAWMSVGSDGRREQILRTDMDNAFIFEPGPTPESDEEAREQFLQLTQRVVSYLVECGFSRCQGGVMASNPKWCRTSAEWIAEVNDVERFGEPEHLLRGIVLYDLRFVAGTEAICRPVRDAVFESVGTNPWLQRRLAEMVVATPAPLNFWGKFMVERRGGYEGQFDIKGRAMAPLRDAARLLALKHGLTRHYSTGGRWLDLGRQVPTRRELAQLAREGYDFLLRIRTLTGLRRGDVGRFIDPAALTKMERAQLTNVFDVLRMVQEAVRLETSLDR